MAFYRYFENELFIAPNFVYGPDYTLLIEDKDTYTYPVSGWYLFDSIEDACSFFEIDVPIQE